MSAFSNGAFDAGAFSASAFDFGTAPPTSVVEEVFTGGFVLAFERAMERRRRQLKKQLELEEEAERIQDETNREIAQLLHKQEIEDTRKQELSRLSALVATEQARVEAAELGERLQRAVEKAAAKQTEWAFLALEREIKRAQEEEEFILHALRLALEYD
jgi:hypothetical protein